MLHWCVTCWSVCHWSLRRLSYWPPVHDVPFSGISRWLRLTYFSDCSNSDNSGTLVSGRLVRTLFNWCLCTYSWVSAPRRRCLQVDSLLVPGLPNFGYQSVSFLVKKPLCFHRWRALWSQPCNVNCFVSLTVMHYLNAKLSNVPLSPATISLLS